MVNNSTNINKMNNHHSPQATEYKNKDYNIWYLKCKSCLRQAQICDRVKLVNGIPTLPI